MIVTNLFSAVKRFPAATTPEFLFLQLFRAAHGRVPRVHVQSAGLGRTVLRPILKALARNSIQN